MSHGFDYDEDLSQCRDCDAIYGDDGSQISAGICDCRTCGGKAEAELAANYALMESATNFDDGLIGFLSGEADS